MAGEVIEHVFECPYCGQHISMLLDPAEGDQAYIEDCEVCCNPIDLRVRVEDGTVVSFDAVALD